jgi:transcriptional regulator with XRE-family HTH domain
MTDDAPRKRIAAEIRAEIARQKKTQRDVAAMLGMTLPSIQFRLSGERSFRAEEIAALAEKLGVPVDQFLSAAADPADESVAGVS